MTAMITLKEKIGYGLGDMASSMFWKLFGSYLMIFYTDVFGLPAAVVGTMFLITRVWWWKRSCPVRGWEHFMLFLPTLSNWTNRTVPSSG